MAWRRRKDIFTNQESVTHLISHKAVYRTAPATPDLFYTDLEEMVQNELAMFLYFSLKKTLVLKLFTPHLFNDLICINGQKVKGLLFAVKNI